MAESKEGKKSTLGDRMESEAKGFLAFNSEDEFYAYLDNLAKIEEKEKSK